MKLVSWNVNGFRACLGKGFEAFFNMTDADIFCLFNKYLYERKDIYVFSQKIQRLYRFDFV